MVIVQRSSKPPYPGTEFDIPENFDSTFNAEEPPLPSASTTPSRLALFINSGWYFFEPVSTSAKKLRSLHTQILVRSPSQTLILTVVLFLVYNELNQQVCEQWNKFWQWQYLCYCRTSFWKWYDQHHSGNLYLHHPTPLLVKLLYSRVKVKFSPLTLPKANTPLFVIDTGK